MAEEKRTKEDVESDLQWEKFQKKLLLIGSAICCGIGLIYGLINAHGESENFIMAIWIGIGAGGFISYLPAIPHMFKQRVKEGGGCLGNGCIDNITELLKGIVFTLIFLSALGPIGLLVRFLMSRHRIKKLERELSSFGQ